MNKRVAALLAATLLSGCQSIFGHRAKLEVRPVGADESAAAALVALEEGRQNLRAGNVGLAIVALQRAAESPDAAAEAANGLGVAYAMLGRGDLAERYFQKAIESDPAEAKYASNLARYYRSRDAALARAVPTAVPPLPEPAQAAEQELAASEPQQVVSAGPGSVHAASAPGRMIRVSDREVTIRTLPDAIAVAAADGRKRNPRYVAAQVGTRPLRYPVRVELAPVRKAR